MTVWTLEQAAAEIGVESAVVMGWIEQSWVLPDTQDGAWRFDELDLARLRLIAELTQELQIGEDAIPVVLNLLDQIYDLRDRLVAVERAIEAASPETRAEIARLLGEAEKNE